MVENRKIFLLIFNFLSLLLFSGTVFGWTALSDILVKEGFYDWRCTDGESPCKSQIAALDAAFTWASTAYGMSSLPGGILLDKAGPLVTIIVGGVIEVVSILGIAYCKWGFEHYNVELFPICLIGVAIGGSLVRFCGYYVGFLFPGKGPLLIALASVLFDGSCMVFPVIHIFYNLGIKYQAVFLGYVGIGVVVFILLPIAWALNMREINQVRAAAIAKQRAGSAGGGFESKSICQQVRSLEFVAIFIFSSIQLTHSNLYIGSVNDVNTEISHKIGFDEDQVSLVNTIVSFVIPMGFLAVPLITASIHHFGNVGTLQITNILGIALNSLQLVPSLWLQLLSVTLFATFRAFLFSNVPQFNAHYFGVLNMGRIQGICFLSGGVVNLLQVPLINYSLVQLHGHFRFLLLICIGMTIIPMIPCTVLQCREWHQVRDTMLAAGLQEQSPARSLSPSIHSSDSSQGRRRSNTITVVASPFHGSSTPQQMMCFFSQNMADVDPMMTGAQSPVDTHVSVVEEAS